MDIIQAAVLIGAAMTMGVMAGIFQVYAYAVMPGLRSVDDRTFVGAFQAMDAAIMNPAFLATFLGALLLTGLAALLHLAAGDDSVVPWATAAFGLYLAVVISTIAVNVPLNDAIKAAGRPDGISDLAGVRRRFNEAKWARWNVFRALLSTAAFGCLAWTLVQHGRL